MPRQHPIYQEFPCLRTKATPPTGFPNSHLAHLVPALIRDHPRRDGRHYRAEDVTRWLRTFADHLAAMARRGYSATDIHFHQLWVTTSESPGSRIHRSSWLLVAGRVLGFTAVSATILPDSATVWTKLLAVLTVASLVAAVLLADDRSWGNEAEPRRLDLRAIRKPRTRRLFMIGTAAMTIGGLTPFVPGRLVVGVSSPASQVMATLWLLLAIGVVLGMAIALADHPKTTTLCLPKMSSMQVRRRGDTR